MTLRRFCVWAGIVLSSCTLSGAAHAAPDWRAVDAVFGSGGTVLPGGVHRYGWPRRDLNVVLDGVTLDPGLALGSWGGFLATGRGDQVMAMGDLVLLESEVGPALSALQAGGLEVAAIHNHLLGETPRIIYVHFMGRGDAVAVARALHAALATTKTPPPAPPTATPSAAEKAIFHEVQAALGRSGSVGGRILHVTVPRAEAIEVEGMVVPAAGMSVANAMGFQVVGDRVATTGDFVLVASEVNPVIAALRAHGFQAMALHSHMLSESPRLFFLHFWGLDTPQKVGEALAAALAKVHTQPAG